MLGDVLGAAGPRLKSSFSRCGYNRCFADQNRPFIYSWIEMEHAFLPDDGGFECIFCGRTASAHQKASGGSYESTKPAERDLEMEDEDDWDAIQEELRRLTRRCRQARAAARSSQPTHPRASPAWLSRLRKRRPERRPSCSSQK